MNLDPLTEKLSVLNPTAILERGYSVAFRSSDRQIIRAAEDIEKDHEFELLTSKGSLLATKIADLTKSKNKQ